jgi:hypothetical protein
MNSLAVLIMAMLKLRKTELARWYCGRQVEQQTLAEPFTEAESCFSKGHFCRFSAWDFDSGNGEEARNPVCFALIKAQN